MATAIIDVNRARELFDYSVVTGVLRWRIDRCPNVKAGDVAGYVCRHKGYRKLDIGSRHYPAHRVIWLWVTGKWPASLIDHENGIRDDNRWLNLRDVTHQLNQQNQRHPSANNTSGYLGVTWDKEKGKWKAQIKVDNRSRGLGRYDDIEEAAEAYLTAKRQLHTTCTI